MRKAALKVLPVEIRTVFKDLIEEYVKQDPNDPDPDPDQYDLDATYQVGIESYRQQGRGDLEEPARRAGKPLVLGPPNVYATQQGAMAKVPTPEKPGHLYIHHLDQVLEESEDAPPANLPKVVTLTAKNKLWLQGRPGGEDVWQGGCGDCC